MAWKSLNKQAKSRDPTIGVKNLDSESIIGPYKFLRNIHRSARMLRWATNPSRLYISIWFLLNITLTLMNKSVMEFSKFRFPVTLSYLHQALGTFLCFVLTTICPCDPDSAKRRDVQDAPVDFEETIWRRILALSLLFSLNIIFGNISLRHCSVAFVQVVRAIIPMSTMIFSVIFLHSKYSAYHYFSCFVVCIGVAFSCFGEINLTTFGLFATIFGCILSSLKSISVKLSLSGSYELQPFNLLDRMSPISGIEMFALILISGENRDMVASEQYRGTLWPILSVLTTGVVAFLVNLTNFQATAHTSPLTVTIVGCVKQVVTIVLSVLIFDKKLTLLNTFGVVVTTCGSLWYGLLKFTKQPTTREPAALQYNPPRSARRQDSPQTPEAELLHGTIDVNS
jgi:drug/metabolite transporter (DMT)-like permease